MQRTLLVTAAVVAAIVLLPAPAADAGGYFGLHVSNLGFGVTVGFGDWGVYTSSWSDPSWSMSFTSTLHGYGEWVYVAGLGRVWRPWVEVGWRPYTHGRWVLTSFGWTWVAYEPWGYVPHHYGSWANCTYGWVWVPGYAYAPANVVWVHAGGYIGWYPRPPSGWSHAARGYNHGYRHGYRDGYRDGWRDARFATFVDWHHLASDNVSHHAVAHTTATREHHAAVANAPTADQVRARGGASVPVRSVSRRTVASEGREIELVRPDGVTADIERHAESTIRRTLAPTALERRQPRTAAGASSHGVPTRASSAGVEDHTGRSRVLRTPESGTGPRSRTDVRSGTSGSRSLPTTRPSISHRTTTTEPAVDRGAVAAGEPSRRHADTGANAVSRINAIERRTSRPASVSKPDGPSAAAERPPIRARGAAATRSADPARGGTASRSTVQGVEASPGSRSIVRRPVQAEPSATARPSSPPPRDDARAEKRSKPRPR